MLTDTVIRNTQPGDKPIRLFDGRGLYLEVSPKGGRWWRLKYRFRGRENRISLGVFPEIGVKVARARRDAARRQVAMGIDPSAARKAEKAGWQPDGTFEGVAREWVTKFTPSWTHGTGDKLLRRFKRDVFPVLGTRPIGEITAPELLKCVQGIEEQGKLDAAHRTLQVCGRIFAYAIVTGRAVRNPATDIRRGALPPSPKVKHFPAITDPEEIGGLLRAIDGYQGEHATRCALRLAPLTFVRPGELRKAEWAEFDLDQAEWNIPAIRMKTGAPHLVPLSAQAVAVLRELFPVTRGGRYVFPCQRTPNRPMSEATINGALRRLGYDKDTMTGHGFRAMARTVLDEVLGVRPDFIEHQLAHTVRGPLGRAYNRTTHLPERRRMMQRWADYLDSLKNGAEVVPLRFARPG
jgi:integrase